ncbi:MAG: 3-isopropylmalate dehydratase small subunit [Alphaproteobacteria bacterium]|nr:3-isopropylmalate dehydratase small subunit [Alphaproteobacteria bacterium]
MKLGQPIPTVVGRGVFVPGDDIDTDRIIPARFMKCVTFDGLGAYAFHDERFREDGSSKGHPLDAAAHAGASVLVSGRNFGCGSSREHAPQALYRFGLRAVLAPSFAEIFAGNCTTLGIVCGVVGADDADAIGAAVTAEPGAVLTLDVAGGRVALGDRNWPMALPASTREALLSGRWDPLQELAEQAAAVSRVARALPYAAWTGLDGAEVSRG